MKIDIKKNLKFVKNIILNALNLLFIGVLMLIKSIIIGINFVLKMVVNLLEELSTIIANVYRKRCH